MATQMGVFPPQHVVTTEPGYGYGGGGGGGNIPRGLEYLNTVNEIRIKQKVDCIEAVCKCCVISNTYTVHNPAGEQVFYATEGESNCCTRCCLRNIRPFEMRLTDNMGGEVIRLSRPCRCGSCWYPCCLQECTVLSPTAGNVVLGYVKQEWSILKPMYTIENANHEPVLKIRGPYCPYSCWFCDVHLQIFSLDGNTVVGEIRKEWSGLLKEFFTNADNFTITFDADIDVSTKATVLGAAFLSDYMYFER